MHLVAKLAKSFVRAHPSRMRNLTEVSSSDRFVLPPRTIFQTDESLDDFRYAKRHGIAMGTIRSLAQFFEA